MTGSYELEFRAHSYRNPSGRCDECRTSANPDLPRCCDEDFSRPLDQACLQSCDTSVDICLRALGSTGISCAADQLLVGSSVAFDTNSFDFPIGNVFFGFQNPRIFPRAEAWAVSNIIM